MTGDAAPPRRAHRPPRRSRHVDPAHLVVPGSWATQGNCTVPPETHERVANAVWDAFDEPTTGITTAARAERLATVRRMCRTCPVLLECHEFGMTQSHGFYGGLTPEEREARRRGDYRPHEQLMQDVRSTERTQRMERAARAPYLTEEN